MKITFEIPDPPIPTPAPEANNRDRKSPSNGATVKTISDRGADTSEAPEPIPASVPPSAPRLVESKKGKPSQPAPESKDASTPEAARAAKATTRPAAVPSPQSVAKQPPKASEEKPSPPAASYSSGNFDHQGGIMDVADPDKGKPGVFQFVAPKEGQA